MYYKMHNTIDYGFLIIENVEENFLPYQKQPRENVRWEMSV